MASSSASLTPCYSLRLAHSLLVPSLCSHLEAAPTVRLHVSHPTDGLDLGVVSSPVIPVLVRPHLKDILVATVARVLVSHPAVWGIREEYFEQNGSYFADPQITIGHQLGRR